MRARPAQGAKGIAAVSGFFSAIASTRGFDRDCDESDYCEGRPGRIDQGRAVLRPNSRDARARMRRSLSVTVLVDTTRKESDDMEPISMASLLAKLQEARAVVSGLPAPAAPAH